MKPVLAAVLSVLGLLFAVAPATAQVSRAIRECAEAVVTKFGSKAAGESIEGVSKKITMAVTKYGDETLPAFTKVGAPAFAAAEEAAETAAPKLKLMARQGSDALWVTADPKKMAIFIKSGDDAADAMLKHKGIADAVLERWGSAAAKPLNAVSTANAKRLAIMTADDDLAKIGRTDEVLSVIGKYGDSAMNFIWRNKLALLVGANLAAFLANPQPFIDGVTSLAAKPLEGTGRAIAEKTNWTVVLLFAMSLGALGLGYWIWKRPEPATVQQGPNHNQQAPGGYPQNQIKS